MKKYLSIIFLVILIYPLSVKAEVYSAGNKSVMPGKITEYSSSSVPNGYLICDGRAVSRTTYGELFEIIGTTYGVGDGSTTFNLPDFTERKPIGKTSSTTLGTKGGSTSASLNISNLPTHAHTYTPAGTISSTFKGNSTTTNTTGSHKHELIWDYQIPANDVAWGTSYYYGIVNPSWTNWYHKTNTTGAHTHTYTPKGSVKSNFSGTTKATGLNGSGNAFDIQNSYIVVNYIIKY